MAYCVVMLSKHQVRRLRATPLGDAPNRLRLAMDALEVTEEQVEAGCGVSQSNINKLLNGNRPNPSRDTMSRLAQFFGCLMDDLFPATEAERVAS